ncbi:MAG: CPBP family glutamic-type intramembrane protease [Candidatus Sulfomarinibacteraceae bacterium]
MERGSTASGSAAHKAASGTIFLDGAAAAEPFLDAAKRIYNLDHHEGCVRSFTLATCEQVMVMILKGLDLPGEQWTVRANEPDLDTVLAIWLLLNHRHLTSNEDLRRRLMPLVRLEGVIDALGLDLAELTGYPDDLQRSTMALIERLREEEIELKRAGAWETIDVLEFTASTLRRIDELFLTPEDLESSREIEELSRTWIAPQRVAIGCRSSAGIYEVESKLRDIHGDRLGLIVLQKGDNVYTLRQSDPFLGTTLEDLYHRLNLLDPHARGDQRWGGSEDIGGSPRATGTGLTLGEIMVTCSWVYEPPGSGRRVRSILAAVLTSAMVLALAGLAGGRWVPGGTLPPRTSELMVSGTVLLGLTLLCLWFARQRGWSHPGLGLPRSWSFLLLLPATVAAGLAGGAWTPLQIAFAGTPIIGDHWRLLAATVVGVVGFELLFRGLCQGITITTFPAMLWTGRRFLSVPNLVTALLSTAAIMLMMLPPFWFGDGSGSIFLWAVAAFAMSLACGIARERSGSVWASTILHLVSAIVALSLVPRLFAT